MFESGEIGLGHLRVDFLREQQSDVDVEAFADELADGGQARFGRRHLDHDIVAADQLGQAPHLGDGRLGVHGKIGRDFQADIAVGSMRCLVHRTQHVGGLLDILDRQELIERHDVEIVRRFGLPQRGIVIGTFGDRLFED